MNKKIRKRAVLAIVGPTASGKSALAVSLAKRLNGEIISADSRQVYRGLDIATGKITRREMKGVPHHLLDVTDPKKIFSAGDFVRLGREAIKAIHARGRLPIIVGGTGFYVDALLGGVSLPSVAPNIALRKRLARKAPTQLYAQLKKLDPVRARTIERQNPVRLIRAIEIASALGTVPKPKGQDYTIYRIAWIGIHPPFDALRRNIVARVRERVRRGMIAEARRLHAHGLSYKRMRELGLEYRLLADYLQGELTKRELVHAVGKADWEYAKRQMRWFGRNKRIQWFKRGNVVAIMKSLTRSKILR